MRSGSSYDATRSEPEHLLRSSSRSIPGDRCPASLFAAFLGYNPMEHLLGPHVLATLPHAQAAALTGRAFFPALMSGPFAQALNVAFTFALVACLIAAGASLLRGGRYHHDDHAALEGEAVEPIPSGIAPALQRTS